MAHKIIQVDLPKPRQFGSEYRAIITAVLDSPADLAELGTGYCPGSVAMVADKGVPAFMLNSSGKWKEI